MLSFLVFGAPTLNPNGTINVVEGTSGSLSCSSSPDTSTADIDATWTFGSTQLASFNRLSNIFIQQHNAE